MSQRDVLICDVCGKGFLRMPRGGIDIWPVWGWTEDAKSEGMCLGNVTVADRETVIRNLDNWEIENVKDSAE